MVKHAVHHQTMIAGCEFDSRPYFFTHNPRRTPCLLTSKPARYAGNDATSDRTTTGARPAPTTRLTSRSSQSSAHGSGTARYATTRGRKHENLPRPTRCHPRRGVSRHAPHHLAHLGGRMGKKRLKRRYTNRHHLTPQSRILDGYDKDKDNIVEWDCEFHDLYHRVFGNLTPSEAKRFIDIITQPNDKWTLHRLKKLRERMTEQKLPMKCRLCGRCNLVDRPDPCDTCGEHV